MKSSHDADTQARGQVIVGKSSVARLARQSFAAVYRGSALHFPLGDLSRSRELSRRRGRPQGMGMSARPAAHISQEGPAVISRRCLVFSKPVLYTSEQGFSITMTQ